MKQLRIPYGISNFQKLREQGYYFIDKTPYIELLENYSSPYVFFLRPRKFGKSLFVSMLEYYYDLNHADLFEKLFKGTYIYDNPTSEKNSYLILKLSFSSIRTSEDIKETEKEFETYIKFRLENFIRKYKLEQSLDVKELSNQTSSALLEQITNILNANNQKLYLLIDEYDNFLNEILVNYGEENYMKITHGTGFIRDFFKKIKDMTQEYVIDRVFITGVTPMAMNDLTSGFNIGDNISVLAEFANMVGITSDELAKILEYYAANFDNYQLLKSQLNSWANGYNFNLREPNTNVFNTTAVWHFMKSVYHQGQLPISSIDPNLRTDFNKLRFLVYVDNRLNGNFSVLKEILDKQKIEAGFKDSFTIGEKLDKLAFRSLLYYLGLLTITERKAETYVYQIPNLSIEQMLWEYIRKALALTDNSLDLDADLLIRGFAKMASNGQWHEVFDYILQKFYEAASVRDFVMRELGIKMFLLAYLNLSNSFVVRSEPEMNRGFADIVMTPLVPEVKFSYIIELKYIKSAELTDNKDTIIAQAIERAQKQLERYRQSLSGTKVKLIVIIASSKGVEFIDEVE